MVRSMKGRGKGRGQGQDRYVTNQLLGLGVDGTYFIWPDWITIFAGILFLLRWAHWFSPEGEIYNSFDRRSVH